MNLFDDKLRSRPIRSNSLFSTHRARLAKGGAVAVLCLATAVMPCSALAAESCGKSVFSQTLTYHGEQPVDGLRVAMFGPRNLDQIFVGDTGPFDSVEMLTAPDSSIRLILSGTTLESGDSQELGFCFDGNEVSAIPVGQSPAYTWTVAGEAEVAGETMSQSPPIAPLGMRLSVEESPDGSWNLVVQAGNMGFEDLQLQSLDWVLLDQSPSPRDLSAGDFSWRPLVDQPAVLAARTEGEPKLSSFQLPEKYLPTDSGVIVIRYQGAAVATPQLKVQGSLAVSRREAGGLWWQDRASAVAAGLLGTSKNQMEVVHRAQAKFPLSGVEVSSFKVYDGSGGWVSVSLDKNGAAVNIADLEVDESQLAEQKFGRLDPLLAEALVDADPDQRLPIVAWAKMSEADAQGAPEIPDDSQPLTDEQIDALLGLMDAHWKLAYQQAVQPVTGVLQQLRISDFSTSDSAPVVSADLLPSEISQLAKEETVDRLYLSGTYESFMAEAGGTIHLATAHDNGNKANGIRLAQVELFGGVQGANPYLQNHTNTNTCFSGSTVVQDPGACPLPATHSTAVAGAITSSHSSDTGVAPESCLWAGGACGNTAGPLISAGNRARNFGARAINVSWGTYFGTGPGLMDRYFDNLVINHLRTVVVANGNGTCAGGSINTASPARAYGVISVGNVDDHDSSLWGNDTMGQCSSFVDPPSQFGDREKPELSAPGTHLRSTRISSPWNGQTPSSTSLAAPVVTGTAGLVMRQHPGLQFRPPALKSILMVSATHNVEGAAEISERDGAGSVVVDEALKVAGNFSSNQWGSQSYSCSAPINLEVDSFYLPQHRRARVALNWATPPFYTQYATRPSADLDLQVIGPSGTIVASSVSWDNAYEIVDFLAPQTGTYRIRVRQWRCDQSPGQIGWAWYIADKSFHIIPGLGWEAEGAGMDIYDINQNGTPDLLMMVYDAASGANNFRYKIGWDLDANGEATGGWTSVYNPPGVGWLGQGADGRLINLDSNPKPELILMAYDAPSGANNFRYVVGWNMSTGGSIGSWGYYPQLPGMGWEGQGAGMEMMHIGGSSRPDFLHVAYDAPSGPNNFRYRYRRDMSTTGALSSTTISCPQVAGLGWEAQGAGVAVGNVAGSGQPDLLFMAYDNPSGGNTFRYRIGTDPGAGCAASWGPGRIIDGVGWEADGAEPELFDIDGDGDLELFLMAYDDPWGGNTFRYRVIDP